MCGNVQAVSGNLSLSCPLVPGRDQHGRCRGGLGAVVSRGCTGHEPALLHETFS